MTTEVYSERIGEALRGKYGELRHAAKRIARMADGNERAARNWLTGSCGPQVRALLLLMAREPAVAEAVLELVERQRALDADRVRLRPPRGSQAG